VQFALARLYYIDKLFVDARKQAEEEEEPHISPIEAALCSHILSTRLPALLSLMADCPDELIAYTAMQTLKGILQACPSIRDLLGVASTNVVDAVQSAQLYDSMWDFFATNRFKSKCVIFSFSIPPLTCSLAELIPTICWVCIRPL